MSNNSEAFLRFINKTNRQVELFWHTFHGEYISYRVLRKYDQFVDINTYRSHPWLAIDPDTKDRLHLDKVFLYYPKAWSDILFEKFEPNNIPSNLLTSKVRLKVYITNPLHSLRFLTLSKVKNYLRNSDEVDQLDLPKVLAEDLKKVIKYRTLRPVIRNEF